MGYFHYHYLITHVYRLRVIYIDLNIIKNGASLIIYQEYMTDVVIIVYSIIFVQVEFPDYY